MATKEQLCEQKTTQLPPHPPHQQELQVLLQDSATHSVTTTMSKEEDEEMTRSALSTFKSKEEEIEKRKMEVRDRVLLQLGRVEEETKRLANIREELDTLGKDPLGKDLSSTRKRIDTVNKELVSLGQSCQKKEREYKEALEALNEKNREKAELVTKLKELVNESEIWRMKKLEELSKNLLC